MSARILIVDDEKVVRRVLVHTLEHEGFEVDEAESVAQALRSLEANAPDLILLDYKLPDGTGIEVLKKIKGWVVRTPVIMVTAHASLAGAVQAVKEGAYDYISKPFEEEELIQTVKRTLEASRLREQVAHLQEEVSDKFSPHNLIAESPRMKRVLKLMERVAESEASTILLLGESGVGKGLIARMIHSSGAGSHQPFMNVTCTALPETLLESELFGHVKGAFTDARTEKKGLLELADGGTVFLDEIGDLPLSLQGKLLRFLEEKTFRRVGGTRDIRVSVRIIAATNKDLESAIESEQFRKDLYFRLNVITLEIPPLRERREDLKPLVESFIRTFNIEFNKKVLGIDPEVEKLIDLYSWPGNVRELRNTLERAILLADSNRISKDDLPEALRRAGGGDSLRSPMGTKFRLPSQGIDLESLEKELITQALDQSRGNFTKAAKLLGMNRHQVRYRMEKYGINPNADRVEALQSESSESRR